MEIYNLKAAYGDAFVIKTMSDGNPFIIVVDGGPYTTCDDIANYYANLGFINLIILTHYDEDHIMGLLKYMKLHTEKHVPVGEFWCNCAREIDFVESTNISDETRYRNASTLAAFLANQQKSGTELRWKEDIIIPKSFHFGEIKIDILSPTEKILQTQKTGYEEYLKNNPKTDEARIDDLDIASKHVITDSTRSIEDLAKTDANRKVDKFNMASIAFLLTAEGKRVLMMGDADPDIVAEAIKKLPNIELPLHLDLVKVSHHGSQNNVSINFLKTIHCNEFMFSTNGGTRNFSHPDRKTLALILKHVSHDSDKPINFMFNYPLEEIQEHTLELLSAKEKESYNCELLPSIIKRTV